MSGISISHRLSLILDYKESSNSDILIYPRYNFNKDFVTELNSLEKLNKKTSVIIPYNNTFIIFDGLTKKIYENNKFTSNNIEFDLIFDVSNTNKPSIIFNRREYSYDNFISTKNELSNLKNVIYTNPLQYDGSIFDGSCYIVGKNTIYQLPSFEKYLRHFSWRQINNISNLEYSYTREGQNYKSLVFKYSNFDNLNINLNCNESSILMAGLLKDCFGDIKCNWNNKTDELSYFIEKNNISYVDNFNINENIDNYKNLMAWRNKLSKLDIDGFGFKGNTSPFLLQ